MLRLTCLPASGGQLVVQSFPCLRHRCTVRKSEALKGRPVMLAVKHSANKRVVGKKHPPGGDPSVSSPRALSLSWNVMILRNVQASTYHVRESKDFGCCSAERPSPLCVWACAVRHHHTEQAKSECNETFQVIFSGRQRKIFCHSRHISAPSFSSVVSLGSETVSRQEIRAGAVMLKETEAREYHQKKKKQKQERSSEVFLSDCNIFTPCSPQCQETTIPCKSVNN